MEIVDVEIAPLHPAHVTPLELIEDFADVAPGWHFLEEDSRLYEAVRGRPACVIRACNTGRSESIDFAFVSSPRARELALRLAILCPPEAGEPIHGSSRVECLQHFMKAFRRYLEGRRELVRVTSFAAQDTEAVSA